MGINHFTHLTQEEFIQTYLGFIAPESYENVEVAEDFKINGDVNWIEAGAVTPVKDQGQCGSCWAFSTTGGLEGHSKIKNGALENFSEQQLVDCSSRYGNQGCNGGLMTSSFKFVKDNGIVHQDEYPYTARQGACKTATGPYKIDGYVEVKDCNTLASRINTAPISVAVDASNWSAYRGGIFSTCGTRLNHGVTLVGTSEGNWWIKNSWSTRWGENGLIRLKAGNTCGVCNMASHPNY